MPPEPDEARAWLFRTARYRAANIGRRKAQQAQLAQRLAFQVTRLTEAPVDNYRADLVRAFLLLTSDDQQLLLLVGSTNLGSSELAELLGCSEQAARLRLHRARKRLDRQVRTP